MSKSNQYLSNDYIDLLYNNPSSFFSSKNLNNLLSEKTLIDITHTSIFEHFFILKKQSTNKIYSSNEERFYSTLKNRFEDTISRAGNSYFHFLCTTHHEIQTMTQLITNNHTSLKSLCIKNKNEEFFYQDIIRDYQITKPKNTERTKYILFFQAIMENHYDYFKQHISPQDQQQILYIILANSFLEEKKSNPKVIIKQLTNVKKKYLPLFLTRNIYLECINANTLNYLINKNKWNEVNNILTLYQKSIKKRLNSNKWLLSHIYYVLSIYNLAQKRTIAINYLETCFSLLNQITPEDELESLYKAEIEGQNIFHYVFSNKTLLSMKITKRVYTFICNLFLNDNNEKINELLITQTGNKRNCIKIPLVYLLFNYKGKINDDFIEFWTNKAKLLSQNQMKKHFDVRYLVTFSRWNDLERCKFYLKFLKENQLINPQQVHKILPLITIKSDENSFALFQLIYTFAIETVLECKIEKNPSDNICVCCRKFYIFIIRYIEYYKKEIGEKWFQIIFRAPKNYSQLYKKKIINLMNKQEIKRYYKDIFKIESFEEKKIHLNYIFNMYSNYLKNRDNKNDKNKIVYKVVNKNINLLLNVVKNLNSSPLEGFSIFRKHFGILELLLRIIVSWEGNNTSLLKKKMFLQLYFKDIEFYIYLFLDNYTQDNIVSIFNIFKMTFFKNNRKTFKKNAKDLIEYAFQQQQRDNRTEISEEEKKINDKLRIKLYNKWHKLIFRNSLMNASKQLCMHFFDKLYTYDYTINQKERIKILEQGLSSSIYKVFKNKKNDSSLLPIFILNGYVPSTLTAELREKYNSLIKSVLPVYSEKYKFSETELVNIINNPFIKEHIIQVINKEEKPSFLYLLLRTKAFLTNYCDIFYSCMPIQMQLDLFDETYSLYGPYANIFTCLSYQHNKIYLKSLFIKIMNTKTGTDSSFLDKFIQKLNGENYYQTISNKNSFCIFVKNLSKLITSISTRNIMNWITNNNDIEFKFNDYIFYMIQKQFNIKSEEDNNSLPTFLSIIRNICDIYPPEYKDVLSQLFPNENNQHVFSKFQKKFKFLELYTHDFDVNNNYTKREFDMELFKQRSQTLTSDTELLPFFIKRIQKSNNEEEVKILCSDSKIQQYILTHDCISVFPIAFGKFKKIDDIILFLNVEIKRTLIKHCSVEIITYLFKKMYKAVYKKKKCENAILMKYNTEQGEIFQMIKNFKQFCDEKRENQTEYSIVEFDNEIFPNSFLFLFKRYVICFYFNPDFKKVYHDQFLYIYYSYYPLPISLYNFNLDKKKKSNNFDIQHFLCLFDKEFETNIDKYKLFFNHNHSPNNENENENVNLHSQYSSRFNNKMIDKIKKSFNKTKELFVNNSIILFKNIGKDNIANFFEKFPSFNESYCHLLSLILKFTNFNYQKNILQKICKITFDYIPTSIKYIMNKYNYDLTLSLFPIMTVIKTSRVPQLQEMLPYLLHKDVSEDKCKTMYILITQITFLQLNDQTIEEHINLSLNTSSIENIIKDNYEMLYVFICYSIYKDDKQLFDKLYTYWGFDNKVERISKRNQLLRNNNFKLKKPYYFLMKKEKPSDRMEIFNNFSQFFFSKQHFNFIELMIANQAQNVLDCYVQKHEIITNDDNRVRIAKLILRSKNISLYKKYENVLSIKNENNEINKELLLEVFTLKSKTKLSNKNIYNYLKNKYKISVYNKFCFAIENHFPKKKILKYYKKLSQNKLLNNLLTDLQNQNNNNNNENNQQNSQNDLPNNKVSGFYWWSKFIGTEGESEKYTLIEKIIELNLYEIIEDLFKIELGENDKANYTESLFQSIEYAISFRRNKCAIILLDIMKFPPNSMKNFDYVFLNQFIQWLKLNESFTQGKISSFTNSKITKSIIVYDTFFKKFSSSYPKDTCNFEKTKVICNLVRCILFSSQKKQIKDILQFLLTIGDQPLVYSTIYLLIIKFKLQLNQKDIYNIVTRFRIAKEDYLMYLIYLYEQTTKDILINIDAISTIRNITDKYVISEIKLIQEMPNQKLINDNNEKINNLKFVSALINKNFLSLAIMWINEKKMFSTLLKYSGQNESIALSIKCITSTELFYIAYLLLYKIPKCMNGQQFNLKEERKRELLISHKCFSSFIEYPFALEEKYFSPDDSPTISNDKRFEHSSAYYYIFTIKQEEMFKNFEFLNTHLYQHITKYVENLFKEIYSPLKPIEHHPSKKYKHLFQKDCKQQKPRTIRKKRKINNGENDEYESYSEETFEDYTPFQDYVYYQNHIRYINDPKFLESNTHNTFCEEIKNLINDNQSTETNPIQKYINNVIRTTEILKKFTTEEQVIINKNTKEEKKINDLIQSVTEQVIIPKEDTLEDNLKTISDIIESFSSYEPLVGDSICYICKFLQEKNNYSKVFLRELSHIQKDRGIREIDIVYWDNLISIFNTKYSLIIDLQYQLQQRVECPFIIELEFFDMVDICESFIKQGFTTQSEEPYSNYMPKLMKAMMNLLMNFHRNTPLRKKLFNVIAKETKIYNETINEQYEGVFNPPEEIRLIRFVCQKQNEILGKGQVNLNKTSKEIIDSIFKINIGNRIEKEGEYFFKYNRVEKVKCFEYSVSLSWVYVNFEGNIKEFLNCVNEYNFTPK